MKTRYIWPILLSLYCLVSCTNSKENHKNRPTVQENRPEFIPNPVHDSYKVKMTGFDINSFKQHYKERIEPPDINLNQTLEGKSVSELYLLKQMVFAMKGRVFRDALCFHYFDTIDWYQPPFWEKDFKISLNKAEQDFIGRIDYELNLLTRNNILESNLPNVENILNDFQWNETTKHNLKNHGFYLDYSTCKQPFELYEQNRRELIPSFITSDLILNQMHLFYGMLENEIEQIYLTQSLKTMLEIINVELYASYEKTLDPNVEKAIEENLLYYSIPLGVITGKKKNLIGSYNELYVDELTKVLEGRGVGSKILNDPDFDYKIFKPFQHYAANDDITKYFKALTWLQKVDLCLNNEKEFNKAIIIAYIIYKNKDLQKEYHDFIELKTYFSSQRDQFTLWNLADKIKENDEIARFEDLFKETFQSQLRDKLVIADREICKLTVSLMPTEYQNRFTDLGEITSNKSMPSSLDLFASLNNAAAKTLYNAEYPNDNKQVYLSSISENLVNISSQEDARSMDWLSTLLTSFNEDIRSPDYMSGSAWKRKELNAAMSSWIQLNQRVHLKAAGVKNNEEENKSQTVIKGYVEPNRELWQACQTLLNNTRMFFSERNKLSKKSARRLNELIEIITFLDTISQKQLSGTSLSDEEYIRISYVGNECHNLSLRMINPNYSIKRQKISSEMAFATNLFHTNESKNLMAGIGNPGYLYAIAEIDGFLYLTRGAVYHYYEISDFKNRSITRNQWKKLLNDNLHPVNWTNDLYSQEHSSDVMLTSRN